MSNAIRVPLVVDADNGYGNEENVLRTVREPEHAGAAAMIMDDQLVPKGCGHAAEKHAVPLEHYLRKLECSMRAQAPLVIIARTDVMSIDEAVQRTTAFHAAGADVTLIDGLPSLEVARRVGREVPGKKQVNLIHVGKTPLVSSSEFMPLFHIHGLMVATLSSITASASVYCAIGFVATDFFDTRRTRPNTWYTDVPTFHQAALAHARAGKSSTSGHSLLLVLSSSASLAPTVMRDLEQTFGVPVVEAHGMTEASHRMASNPLPRRAQKPSFVGLAAGPKIALCDEADAPLPTGRRGEVVIRGPGVTAGYLENARANAKA